METRERTRRAREALDARLAELGPASRFAPPRLGWVRAVRDALGMSAAELGKRMGISGASVRSLEDKERGGGARLSTLARAAQAMDCTLVYSFVPNSTLDATVRRQAEKVVAEHLGHVQHTMALEEQEAETPLSVRRAQLEAIIGSRRLWSAGDES